MRAKSTHKAAFDIITREAQLWYPRLNIPDWLGEAFARLLTGVAYVTRQEPFYPITLRFYVYNDWRVSSEKAQRELGFVPTPFVEGARRTIAWYRAGQPICSQKLNVRTIMIDQVKIFVQSGDGGDVSIAFRREKFVPHGGPAGGDGGDGGDIIFTVNPKMNTLAPFGNRIHFRAQHGDKGGTSSKAGRDDTMWLSMCRRGRWCAARITTRSSPIPCAPR